jgi:hypothetical protein
MHLTVYVVSHFEEIFSIFRNIYINNSLIYSKILRSVFYIRYQRQ